jgi:hypothetical protein
VGGDPLNEISHMANPKNIALVMRGGKVVRREGAPLEG